MPLRRPENARKKLKSKQKHPITCAPALILSRYRAAWESGADWSHTGVKNLTIEAEHFM
jgi:hypothetical protein